MKSDDTACWFEALNQQIIHCAQCPRLVEWREQVAREKVKRHMEETYWGKAVPSFGDSCGRLLIVGLAPAAHGGNRTGRVFTGDRSGDWLYRALYRAGFSNQPNSTHLEDGLILRDSYVTAVAHCAPPQNKLLPQEIQNCQPFLKQELASLKNLQVIVALGKTAFDVVFNLVSAQLLEAGTISKAFKRPAFSHGVTFQFSNGLTLLGSYHPSQQNTFTGKLTEPMFDGIFSQVREILGS